MKVDLSENEIALCIACLENGAKDLRDGIMASERLGFVRQDFMLEKVAGQMDELRARLLTQATQEAAA